MDGAMGQSMTCLNLFKNGRRKGWNPCAGVGCNTLRGDATSVDGTMSTSRGVIAARCRNALREGVSSADRASAPIGGAA